MSFNAACQENHTANGSALATDYEMGDAFAEKVKLFSALMEKKRSGSEIKFLRSVFRETHRTFLKKYEAYSSLKQLVQKGQYDCLTATMLYSRILETLGFNFRIVETNYHIFMLVKVDGKEVLLETTNRISGIVTDKASINAKVSTYRLNAPAGNEELGKKFEFGFHLLKEVKNNELVGLLYFNQAVKEFNKHNWSLCLQLLINSSKIYHSPRIREISSLALAMMNREGGRSQQLTSNAIENNNFIQFSADEY